MKGMQMQCSSVAQPATVRHCTPPGLAGQSHLQCGCYITADSVKMVKFYLLCYSGQFEGSLSPSIDTGAQSHLGK